MIRKFFSKYESSVSISHIMISHIPEFYPVANEINVFTYYKIILATNAPL